MSFTSVKLILIQYITGSKKSLGSVEQEETLNRPFAYMAPKFE